MPFLILLSILLASLIIWLPNGKSLKEKMHELIFGAEKISLKKVVYYCLVLFVPFLLISSFFAFDYVPINNNHKNIPLFNPSLLTVKGIIFFEGNGSYNGKKFFMIKSGENIKINPSFSKNVKGKLFIYSSPLDNFSRKIYAFSI